MEQEKDEIKQVVDTNVKQLQNNNNNNTDEIIPSAISYGPSFVQKDTCSGSGLPHPPHPTPETCLFWLRTP